MQKIVPSEAIMTVLSQASRDGMAVARNHQGFSVRLPRNQVEDYAEIRATDMWKRLQMSLRDLHRSWTGHMPEFLAYYRMGFLLGYAQQFPSAYSLASFPESVPVQRSTKAQRKYVRKITRTASGLSSKQKAA